MSPEGRTQWVPCGDQSGEEESARTFSLHRLGCHVLEQESILLAIYKATETSYFSLNTKQ